MEEFIVKHYVNDKNPSIKGNGFDGLLIGECREEAQEFVDFINRLMKQLETENKELKESLRKIKNYDYGYYTAILNNELPEQPKEV